MTQASKLWVDVTLLFEWSGHFTGMQRVLFSYLTRLDKDDSVDLHLFVARSNSFEEISFDALVGSLEKNEDSDTSISPGFIATFRTLPRSARAHGLPFLKRNTKKIPIVGTTLAYSYVTVRSVYRNTGRSKEEKAFTSPIQKEDIVLLIDGNWQDEGRFARQLVREKQRTDFRLAHVVHDVVAIKNPGYVAEGASVVIGSYFKTVLPSVDKLICISLSTQNDVEGIARAWGIVLTQDKSILRIGDSLDIAGEQASATTKVDKVVESLPSRFMLFVGTLEIRKNHRILFYLYKLAKQRGIDLPPTVIMGRQGWMSQETAYVLQHDKDIADKIIILGSVSDESLSELYQKSWLTLFPSLYEGWGLPVVESLRYGKICITSNVSSLPEAGGELADYVSPADPAELLSAIDGYLRDDKKVTQKERLIRQNYKVFSWDSSYEKLYDILKLQ